MHIAAGSLLISRPSFGLILTREILPDQPCCIDGSRDGCDPPVVVVAAAAGCAAAGDVGVVAVGGDAAAGADETTKPPIRNSNGRIKIKVNFTLLNV